MEEMHVPLLHGGRGESHLIEDARATLFPVGLADALRQFLILGFCYIGYDLARAFARGHEAVAIANGTALMNAEKAMHVYIEPWVQAKLSHVPVLMRVLCFVYAQAHLLVILSVLLWIYMHHHDAWRFFRNWFLVMNGMAVTVFALLPTAPPRLLPMSGMYDALFLFSRTNFQSGTTGALANPYAAVPSLHIGYSLFAALAIIMLSTVGRRRYWVLLYPLIVLIAIVATGNHFIADAVAGGLVALAAYFVAQSLARVHAGFGMKAEVAGPLPELYRDRDGT
jgi:hypothetical protein